MALRAWGLGGFRALGFGEVGFKIFQVKALGLRVQVFLAFWLGFWVPGVYTEIPRPLNGDIDL